MIAARNLSYRIGARNVLDDVTFTIQQESANGRFVGILGPNGAGKSSLLRCLLGLNTLSSGSVLLGGKPLEKLSRREIASLAAFVPQFHHLEFPFPVLDVVSMGRTPHRRRFSPWSRIDRDAIDRAVALTGIDELLSRRIDTLSGGERQRVVLARALAQATPILMLDEPTANLDLRHEIEFLALLGSLVRDGITVLAVLHDLNLASEFCDELVILKQGKMLAEGPPREVFTAPTLANAFGVATVVEQSDRNKRPFIRLICSQSSPRELNHVESGQSATADS